jgi:hypothetical protein
VYGAPRALNRKAVPKEERGKLVYVFEDKQDRKNYINGVRGRLKTIRAIIQPPN